jgi:hypothetical protein
MLNIETLPDRRIAILEPEGKLEASDFERLGREIEPLIDAQGKLSGLMIYAKAFPGWADFSAFVRHVRFVKEHHRMVRRIAAVSDSAAIPVMMVVAKRFVAAELRHFPFGEKERALAWLQEGR